ncbi:amino acid adenylation domain-containing protein [Streptomyces sp. P1-3]|uniref:amino acid adenylation domain-containing protein n=1 Tax=Streptomyces sp. P1-3 TaxID=3421658 RepID=UPI003D362F55
MADLDGDPTFRALAEQLGRSMGELAAAGSRELSAKDEEIDVRFSFTNAARCDGVTVREAADGASAVPLVRAVADGAGRVRLAATAVTNGSAEDADLLTEELMSAARSGRRNADVRVSVLPLLDAAEMARVTSMNGDGSAAEEAQCLHELVRRQARLRPDAQAVVCGPDALTYRQLDERSDWFADALAARGVRPGHVVGVAHERSARLVVILLAVLKAGACYLALDPGDPPVRCAQLLASADAVLTVAEEDLRHKVNTVVPTVVPSELEDADATSAVAGGQPAVTPDHLAYVSCTSGSTGEPKAVGVPHRAVARLLRGPDWVRIGPDDVFLTLAPVAFDASTIEIWGPLLNGGRLAVHPGDPSDLERLAREIESRGVTVLLLTTGLLNQMVTSQPACFRTVRHVLTGGDVASPGHVERLLSAHPHLTFTNGYGPTENTSYTTCWTVRGSHRGPVPIGRPIRGTRIAVLDAALHPVPVGVCGELYASGDGLARGYIGRPAATAERFVADPFATEPGGRMYRTGDLVRRLADGSLEFVGRVDQQVKIRGYRVELGHIEAALTRHREVRAAAVVVQEDRHGTKRLLAYVVAEDGVPAPDLGGLGQRLATALRGELPPYMVPWAVLTCPELPLNRNGKLDRRALPPAHRPPAADAHAYVPPRTPLERRLAELWGEILGVEPVGIEDNFFHMGGYSLLAAHLLADIQRDLGIDVPARALYLKPTIAGLLDEIAVDE